jgi:hypothetical protein
MVKLMNFLPRAALFALATLFSVVKADLEVTSPSSSIWWVAKSQNVLAWSCQDTTITNFTVLVSNTSPTIAVAPLAIIAIQDNFDCSVVITQDEADQPAGTGWTILLADPFNETNVYATSQPFEIKPLGSLYPSQTTPSANASSNTASSTGTGSAAASKPTSAAISMKGLGWGIVTAAVAGAVGVML